MVLLNGVREPRMKKYSTSSAICRVLIFDGGLRSSGEVALVGALGDTVGWRLAGLAGEGTNGEAMHPSDDSCLSTLSKSKSSPECECEYSHSHAGEEFDSQRDINVALRVVGGRWSA
jgi:hypothetical protein